MDPSHVKNCGCIRTIVCVEITSQEIKKEGVSPKLYFKECSQ